MASARKSSYPELLCLLIQGNIELNKAHTEYILLQSVWATSINILEELR